MLLLLLVLATLSLTANGQDICNALPCGNLKVEIVRQDWVNNPNDPSDHCASGTACDDRFSQIAYKVYLRYKKPATPGAPPPPPFNLDYKELDIIVNLRNLNIPRQYSSIDVGTTQNCLSSSTTGASWLNYADPNQNGDEPIFTASPQSVSLSFSNVGPGGNCGSFLNGTTNSILFTYATPNLVAPCGNANEICAYAEMFTVVVNAYAGELIGLELDANSVYKQKSPPPNVCYPGLLNTGNHQGFLPFPMFFPPTYQNTLNDQIEAQLLPSVPVGIGGRDFPVRIKNAGNVPITVTYLEFTLIASFTQLGEPFAYPTGAVPQEYSGGFNPGGLEVRYLHYRIPFPGGLVLPAGGTSIVTTIRIGPAIPNNLSWEASLGFQDVGTRSRLKTMPNTCTTLKTVGQSPIIASFTGTSLCSDPSRNFVIQTKGLFDPCKTEAPIVQAGIKINPSGVLSFTKLVFEVELELTGGLAIIGANYDDWDPVGWNCPSPVPSTCLPVGPDAPCYDIQGGNVFRFCYSSPSAFTITDDAYINIELNNAPGCIIKANLRILEVVLAGNSIACVLPTQNALSTGNSVCPPQLKGKVATELPQGLAVEMVKMVVSTDLSGVDCTNPSACQSTPCAEKFVFTNADGRFGFCVCKECLCFNVAPEKDDNPLNGVTTYDLVLISKHILGSEPLNSPYKMIAADANKSGSITTFDIVEFRKLILGIYNPPPPEVNPWPNSSWRFVDKEYTFPNPANPFQAAFPEIIEHLNLAAYETANFVGVKIGDVNNTATGNRPVERPIVTLSWPNTRTKTGGILTLPITYSGTESLEAIQLGLRYDPAVLELISPSQGDLPSWGAESFNLNQPGEIRTLWLPLDLDNPVRTITQGTTLFYLTFKVKAAIPESGLPIWLDNLVLDNAAWQTDGTECTLAHNGSESSSRTGATDIGFLVNCHPNPSSGELTFSINAEKAGKGRIALFNPYGVRLLARDVAFILGKQEISFPEAVQLPAGVYIWKVVSSGAKAQGHWIKQ